MLSMSVLLNLSSNIARYNALVERSLTLSDTPILERSASSWGSSVDMCYFRNSARVLFPIMAVPANKIRSGGFIFSLLILDARFNSDVNLIIFFFLRAWYWLIPSSSNYLDFMYYLDTNLNSSFLFSSSIFSLSFFLTYPGLSVAIPYAFDPSTTS